MLQYGQYDETEFWEYTLSSAEPSSWIYWPTPESPSNLYKYVSGEFNVSMDLKNYARQTDGLLDYLGDLGGLIDILIMLAKYIVGPFASYRLQAALLSSLFRFDENEPNKPKKYGNV